MPHGPRWARTDRSLGVRVWMLVACRTPTWSLTVAFAEFASVLPAFVTSVPRVVVPDGAPMPHPGPDPEGLPRGVVAALHRHILLRDTPELLAAVLELAERVTLTAGQPLHTTAETPEFIYLLLDGEVQVVAQRNVLAQPELHADDMPTHKVATVMAVLGEGSWVGLPLLAWHMARAVVDTPLPALDARIAELQGALQRLGKVRADLDASKARQDAVSEETSRVVEELDRLARQRVLLDPPTADAVAEVLPRRPDQIGPPTALRLSLDDAAGLCGRFPAFRRVVEHATVLAFRADIRKTISANPILAGLDDTQITHLMQISALTRIDHPARALAPPYLPAGSPSGHVALLLSGNGQVFLPDEGAGSTLVGDFSVGELIGHDALVLPDDAPPLDPSTIDPGRARFPKVSLDPEAAEPPRRTAAYVQDLSLVLEVDWKSLRWLIARSRPTWLQALAWYSPGASAELQDPGEVVAFIGDRQGLGATTTLYGTAIATVRAMRDENPQLPETPSLEERSVFVVDFQGAATWEPWLATPSYRRQTLHLDGLGAEPTTAYYVMHVPGTPDPLQIQEVGVAWSDDPRVCGMLLGQLRLLPGTKFVFAAGIIADHPLFEFAEVMLTRLRATIVWLTERPTAGYALTRTMPNRLIRVDRLTKQYWEEARKEMRLGEAAWGDGPDAAPLAMPVQSATVRIPTDLAGGVAVREMRHDELWGDPESQLARSFERMARVVRRRTVGLALGGGGVWGAAHIALIRELAAVGVPVDYVAGTSFGAVVAGVYAGGGVPALERFLREACPDRFQNSPALAIPHLLARSEFYRATTVNAMSSTEAVQVAIDGTLERSTGEPRIPLACTHVPFYPVSTNLDSTAPFTTTHGSVGFGVRASSGLPPALVGMWFRGQRILDGALVANVPAEIVRLSGADFVVSANVVGPRASEGVPGQKRQRAWDASVGRILDALRGVFLLGWKAGDDQGRLRSDYRIDAWTHGAEFTDFWKGQAIVVAFQRALFQKRVAWKVRDRWRALPVRDGCGHERVNADVKAVLDE
ncbi:MAG: putative acylesterase/phospholipase RssA/CRP-like cAMP-binding protein [Myxococcota bacterium]|jgi:predicted acylesterase/phospholipase RssA/CRP-like cAMP-binding protein